MSYSYYTTNFPEYQLLLYSNSINYLTLLKQIYSYQLLKMFLYIVIPKFINEFVIYIKIL